MATSNPAPTTADSIIFTAYVSAANGNPTGIVKFYDGATLLGSGTLNGIGTTAFVTSSLTTGSHTISAAYQATTNFNTSGAIPG